MLHIYHSAMSDIVLFQKSRFVMFGIIGELRDFFSMLFNTVYWS